MDLVESLYKKAKDIEEKATFKANLCRRIANNISETKNVDEQTLTLLSNNERIFGNNGSFWTYCCKQDRLHVHNNFHVVSLLAQYGDPLCEKIFNQLASDTSYGANYILMNSPIPAQMVLRTMSGEDYEAYLNGEKSITNKEIEYFLK